jgi:hypothetical protein
VLSKYVPALAAKVVIVFETNTESSAFGEAELFMFISII